VSKTWVFEQDDLPPCNGVKIFLTRLITKWWFTFTTVLWYDMITNVKAESIRAYVLSNTLRLMLLINVFKF